ncbi:hypothetical protein [Streptomyces sp. UG1]|uniref:hypothetical protein n=1 Tax=Streptomyces sp. UG1 TaxID=3417652 RepID=UPI003CF610A3
MAENEDGALGAEESGAAPAGPFVRDFNPLTDGYPRVSPRSAVVQFYRNGGYTVKRASGVQHVDKPVLARPHSICEIALGTYVTPLQMELPAAGGTTFFKAEVDIQWAVTDPHLAALEVVTDVANRLTSPVLERLREVTTTYRVTEAEQANRAITRECAGGRWADLGSELGLRVRLYVRLRVDDRTIEHADEERDAHAQAKMIRLRQESYRRMLQGGELEQLSFMLAADPEGAKDFLEKIRQEGRQDEKDRVARLFAMATRGELATVDVETQVLNLLNQGDGRPMVGPIGTVPARRPRELEPPTAPPFNPNWASDEPPHRPPHRTEPSRAERDGRGSGGPGADDGWGSGGRSAGGPGSGGRGTDDGWGSGGRGSGGRGSDGGGRGADRGRGSGGRGSDDGSRGSDDGWGTDERGTGRGGPDRYGSDRGGADGYGTARHGGDRRGTDRHGTDGYGTARHGSDGRGTDRHGSDRRGIGPGGPGRGEPYPGDDSAYDEPGTRTSRRNHRLAPYPADDAEHDDRRGPARRAEPYDPHDEADFDEPTATSRVRAYRPEPDEQGFPARRRTFRAEPYAAGADSDYSDYGDGARSRDGRRAYRAEPFSAGADSGPADEPRSRDGRRALRAESFSVGADSGPEDDNTRSRDGRRAHRAEPYYPDDDYGVPRDDVRRRSSRYRLGSAGPVPERDPEDGAGAGGRARTYRPEPYEPDGEREWERPRRRRRGEDEGWSWAEED